MSEEVKRIKGTWENKPYSIKAVWGKNDHWDGHEFTDEEAEKLFKGELIEFDAVSKAGKPYKCKGRLKISQFEDRQVLSFSPEFDNGNKEYATGVWKGKEIKFNRVWKGYRFTDSDVKALLDDQEISFERLSDIDGKKYPVKGKLENMEYQGTAYVGFKQKY